MFFSTLLEERGNEMQDKWKVLSKRLKGERSLLGSRVEAEVLLKIWLTGNAEVVESGNDIIAFGALWSASKKGAEQWLEIGSLWVAGEFRGRGIISELFASLIIRISDKNRAFLITHDPKVAHLAVKHGMHEESVGTWFASVPWEASCGPCDRMPNRDKTICRFRAVTNECRLFVL